MLPNCYKNGPRAGSLPAHVRGRIQPVVVWRECREAAEDAHRIISAVIA